MRNLKSLLVASVLLMGSSVLGQSLRWSSQGDLQTMDPHSQNESLTNSINGQVYETLIKRDKSLNLVPGLAVTWSQISPTLWRLALRAGVKFHDGAPFAADDVVFSIKRAQALTSAFQSFAVGMGEPRRVDDLTVEFALPQFNPIFLQHATLVLIMSKSWSEKNNALAPLDYKRGEVKHTALHANGTGPFTLESRQPDVKTVFRRHREWWGTFQGNVQEVIYLPIKNDATRTSGLASGEVDLVLDPATQDLQKMRTDPKLRILDGIENRIIFIGMDQSRDELLYSSVKGKNPFKDIRVRQALYHAVDIETLKIKLMRGMSAPTGSMMHNAKGTYDDPEFERRLPFELNTARTLLAQAGYPSGFDITLDCPNNRYINDEEICLALASMWSHIGVKVRVNAMPRATYFPKLDKLDTSMYMLGWGGAVTDAETTLTPVLRSRGPKGVGFYNYGNYKNEKLDGYASASSLETDATKRAALVKAAFREHQEQVHHLPLHRQISPWAMKSNIEAVHRADNWLEWSWVTVR
jgi:peptide/nickel transport system substrate-binding protein